MRENAIEALALKEVRDQERAAKFAKRQLLPVLGANTN
jgi:hypothetical protein